LFKLAISSKLLQGFSVQEIIDYGKKIGFDGIEFWMHQVEESGLSPGELKKLLTRAGITGQIHMDTRDINLASTNRVIRKTSLDQVLSAIEYAALLEAQVVTVHPGRLVSMKEYASLEQIWSYQIEAFGFLANRAEQEGVVIGIENMENRPQELVLTENQLRKIIQGVGSPSLETTLDVAHLYSLNQGLDSLAHWQLPLANVHISQAGSKMHLPIYAPGEIDYHQAFSCLAGQYQGMLVVEGFIPGQEKENVQKSYQWLSDFLKKYRKEGKNSPLN